MRYHKIDGWRGYSIPDTAILGASNTGSWEDSPCRPEDAKAEIRDFRREVLRPAHIKSRIRYGQTSNVFCGKIWVCVGKGEYTRAEALTKVWFAERGSNFRLIHLADK